MIIRFPRKVPRISDRLEGLGMILPNIVKMIALYMCISKHDKQLPCVNFLVWWVLFPVY